MKPIFINGELWRVVGVAPGDPRLIDRTGAETVGTTDPITRTIHISTALTPPMTDKVLLHEIAHAITMSHGLLDVLHILLPEPYWLQIEEWSAQLMENYAIEASALASESLGRPVCVQNLCIDWR